MNDVFIDYFLNNLQISWPCSIHQLCFYVNVKRCSLKSLFYCFWEFC